MQSTGSERRSEYDIALPASADAAAARRRLVALLRGGIAGVAAEPAADVLLLDADAAGATLRLRWTSGTDRTELQAVEGRVLAAVCAALREEGLELA
jgi:hypothetical protein